MDLSQPQVNENQLRYIRSQPTVWSVVLNHLNAFRSLPQKDFITYTTGHYKQGIKPVYPVWKLPLCCFNINIKQSKLSLEEVHAILTNNDTYVSAFNKNSPLVSALIGTASEQHIMLHVQFTADSMFDFKSIRDKLGYCDIFPVYSIADSIQQVIDHSPDNIVSYG